MIQHHSQVLTGQEISLVQKLLRPSPDNPGAAILIELLKSRAALSQLQAAEELVDAVIFPGKLESAQLHAIDASVSYRAILLLEAIANGVDNKDEQFEYEILKITI